MHDLYRQSFGNATLPFVSIKVQIFCLCPKKNRFICIYQKKVVPLQRKINGEQSYAKC